MKKLLLTAAAATLIATSSAYAAEDMFYVRANAGMAKISNVKGYDAVLDKMENNIVILKLKKRSALKGNNVGYFSIGAGYNLTDAIRIDATLDHFLSPTLTAKKTAEAGKIKIKGKITSFLLNGYFDLVKMDEFRLFAGAGVGIASVKYNLDVSATDTEAAGSLKQQSQTNLTTALHLGAGYEVMQNVTAELMYTYRDFGVSKLKATPLKAHVVTAGIRYDI